MSRELEEKTDRLVRLLSAENAAGILINSQPNFAWLTCGGRNGVDGSRENGVASILVLRDGRRYILASSIEMPRVLAEEASDRDFGPVEFSWQDEKKDPGLARLLAADLASGSVVTDAELDAAVAVCRHVLTVEEIERYRGVCRDAAAGFDAVADKFAPGMTEAAAAEALRHELGRRGLQSVVTLAAADERIAQFRHPVPTERAWERTLLLVSCARRHGLTANLSRIISAVTVEPDLASRTRAAASVNAALLDATRPGATGTELYNAAARAYSAEGFGDEIDRHHQGGATGYRTRDWVAHPSSTDVVKQSQAFAWNPSITGTKIEDTILVTGEGIETMSLTRSFPSIVTDIGGREYASAGILEI